jgi:hypothetical protein
MEHPCYAKFIPQRLIPQRFIAQRLIPQRFIPQRFVILSEAKDLLFLTAQQNSKSRTDS